MNKRVFLVVLDSFGIGEEPDSVEYGDAGSNTLCACSTSPFFNMDNLADLGLFNCDDALVSPYDTALSVRNEPRGAYARLREKSKGKDSTVGHWELAGVISKQAFPTYPDGFPPEIIKEFEQKVGRRVLCNKPYSGTDVIRDFGDEMVKTGALIVYTSADSVFQIAAHEDVVPPEELYKYCRIAREMLVGKHGVARVIARPFAGKSGSYVRTAHRHDFSLAPTGQTMLDRLSQEGFDVISVGKIWDLFEHRGITEHVLTSGNPEGIERTLEFLDRDFNGLCFTNLVDTDMIYGHRNDVDGYAKALAYFDSFVPQILSKLRPNDIFMIAADHGCDPITPSTDHSREYVPWVIAGPSVKPGVNLGTLSTFADVSATILDYFGATALNVGTSQLSKILKG